MPFDDIRRPGPERGAHERAINLPPAILWIIGLNVAVQLVREFLPPATDEQLVLQFGLVPIAYTGELGGDWLSIIGAPFVYQFLHAGWVHLGVNMLSLAAFGAPVERFLGFRRFILFYLSAGLVAGLIHILSFPNSADPVVGASGSVSGVFGAVLFLLWRLGRMPSLLPVAGIWIAMNVFFGVFDLTPGAGGAPVAWTAHIGGFIFGLAALRLFMAPNQTV
ncbi:Membrane associated serine protease, rhomboid family [Enhydrobacter aerosaccus]|uniref:Membrane associated serine protease, rhomboid family n=1 Tax=Enhydrobacter aerosaccus TaxID=225324 RepID=A0A1T4QA18_9HYPH|nr:rhomboid family intramembrane serine protease [Enhydrobacter aerosaccus]SKA00524.1 Membrane associated serine protease, rhomboid family [Enhydrobacter aerosaccus]